MSTDHLIALLFQSLCTLALAAVHLGLWRQRRQAFHATWAAAWAVYALRLAFITAFMDLRELVWLFAHQVVTLVSGLLLLWAAAQYALRARWRPAFVLAPIAAVVWAWFSVFVMHDMALAGLSSAVLLSLVTLATAFVFGRRDRHSPSVGARILAWTFLVWGLHHLDYPLLRSQGSGVLIGVFADMTLIALVAVGTLALVLGAEGKGRDDGLAGLQDGLGVAHAFLAGEFVLREDCSAVSTSRAARWPSRPPRAPTNTAPPAEAPAHCERPSSSHRCKAAIAGCPNGTVRSLLPLPSTRTDRRCQSMSPRSSAVSSLTRTPVA